MKRPLSSAGPVLSPQIEIAKLLRQEGKPDQAGMALFAPQHYESRYGYPLLVWLHAENGEPRQLQKIMPVLSMRNYVAVAPAWQAARRRSLPETDVEAAVTGAIDAAARRFHIRRDRVFLLGQFEGGTTALRVGLSSPDEYAGVVSFGGPFPNHAGALVRLEEARRLPLMLAVGADSRRYPPGQVCRDMRLLHAAGISVTLRQYPCGDELTTAMLADANAWLMEQVTGTK